jgi:glycosyltransferase involved in cell wall biosynthesis
MIKICLIIPSLRPGGAERVMSFLADHLDPERFATTLIVIESEKETAYEVKNIKVIYLNKERSREAFFVIFNYLRKHRQDIVLSSIMQLNIMLSVYAIFFWKTRFVIRETFVRGKDFKSKLSFRLILLEKLQKIFIDKIICQSNDIYKDLIENHGYNSKQLVLINNPITNDPGPKKLGKKNSLDTKVWNFITVGRMAKQKGYERVIQALSKFNYPFRYTIIGNGHEKDKIFDLINELNLNKKITHIPFSKQVLDHLTQSDVYLQGSYYEGFPNALLETCIVGTPAIAFDAPGGINEIIQNGINGFIVKSEKEFLEKLEHLIYNIPDPQIVSESVRNRYSKEIIVKKYESLFMDLVS